MSQASNVPTLFENLPDLTSYKKYRKYLSSVVLQYAEDEDRPVLRRPAISKQYLFTLCINSSNSIYTVLRIFA